MAKAKANRPAGQGQASDVEFDFERLPAYRRAEDFVMWAYGHMGRITQGDAYLAGQLHRAARSIALNVGEGAGEFSPPEKAHFYRIARRSGTECVAIVNILTRTGVIDADAARKARRLLHEIVSMLVVMCRACERRGRMARKTAGPVRSPGT